MQVVMTKTDLVTLIGKIQNMIPTKPAMPILANILLEAVDDQLIVSGTDLTVSMRCYLNANVLEEGAIALPARRFFQLIRELGPAEIKISTHTSEHAEISSGSSLFKIHGMNKMEFPHLPSLAGAPEMQCTSGQLREMFAKTVFAAAREDSRYTLNGVQVQICDRTATLIGTDGKRLAKVSSSVVVDTSVQGSFVIPIKAVEEMIHMLEGNEAKATLVLSADKAALECGQSTLITKLLAGQFPDVERIIPKQTQHRLTVHREELMSLLRQVSLFTSQTSNSVRFLFEPGELHLSAMSSEIGEGCVCMPVDFTGTRFEIAFNPFYFLDILRHSRDEVIYIGLNDPHNPALITDSTQAQFVLMPMRLSEQSSVSPAAAFTHT
jgi:DNA polymerase III subunit beta